MGECMKRQTEFLVEKRGGRREWMRFTKLACSIDLALHQAGDEEGWRALAIAQCVLIGLRVRHGVGGPLRTSDLSSAVQQALLAVGFGRAAQAYSTAAAQQYRRREILESSRFGMRLRCPRWVAGLGLPEERIR